MLLFSPRIRLRTRMLTMLLCVHFHPLTLFVLRQVAHNTDITPAFYSEVSRSEQEKLNTA
jgi:hypothetical protein